MSMVLLAVENKSLFLGIFVEGVGRNEGYGWNVVYWSIFFCGILEGTSLSSDSSYTNMHVT